ncbi:MAG: hypothetical protein RI955_1022 [Bacteroidota bacterium]|jgi:choline kinase
MKLSLHCMTTEAIILAGGLGTRLKSLIKNVPLVK